MSQQNALFCKIMELKRPRDGCMLSSPKNFKRKMSDTLEVLNFKISQGTVVAVTAMEKHYACRADNSSKT
jgi:hypothetical protein